MPAPTLEERYDEALAQQMLEFGHKGGGDLPRYLGIELLRFGPGKLWCRATVGEELLTPFGNLHGGVVAAIIDHVTGVVVYPLIFFFNYAATTEIYSLSLPDTLPIFELLFPGARSEACVACDTSWPSIMILPPPMS